MTEYWFYDPEGVQSPKSAGALRGLRLRAGVYEAIAPLRHLAGGTVATVYPSAVLGVALGVDRQRHLRLYDDSRQAWFQTANEAAAEARQAQAQVQAERDARQQAQAQVQAERDARQQAEARLQELLARWQMSDDELDSPRP